MKVDPIREWLLNSYHWLDQRSGGTLQIIELAFHRFNRVRAAEAAASMAFFAIFSIFPLLLVLSSIVGYVLVSAEAPEQVLEFLARAFPLVSRLLEENLVQILHQRSAGGLIGAGALIWSASGVFTTLVRNINRAWPGATNRNFIQGRLIGIGIVGIIILLILLSLIANTFFSLLPRLDIPIKGSLRVYDSLFWNLLSIFIPRLLTFIIFFALYLWLPNTFVRRKEAFWGALMATLAFEATTGVFSWYIGSGFARYEAIYGSLGTLVGALTWIYLVALITLFGAHLSSAVATATRLQDSDSRFGEEVSSERNRSDSLHRSP